MCIKCCQWSASGCVAERQKEFGLHGETEYTWDTHPSILVLNLRATSAAVRVVLNPPCHWMNNWFPPNMGNSPSRVSPNKRQSKYMQKMSFRKGNANTKPHHYFFNAPLKRLHDDKVSNYFSGEEIILDCFKCKTKVAQFCLYFTHILRTLQCTLGIHTEPHWQCDRHCCVCWRCNMIVKSCFIFTTI